jgi:RimJ/RimL family protein N-acetyltransferase
MSDDDVLVTERLRLRRFTSDDVDHLVDLDGDPDVMRFITGGVTTSRREIEDDFLPAFLGYQARGTRYGFWAVEDVETGEFLGWFHLRPAVGAPPDVPELGYRLKRTAWGRGLATEGSLALISFAFEVVGAKRVVAETMAVNVASRRVMEKAGMRLVRSFHQDWPFPIEGNEFGDVEYAIDRPAT